jgi:hypothetical protein
MDHYWFSTDNKSREKERLIACSIVATVSLKAAFSFARASKLLGDSPSGSTPKVSKICGCNGCVANIGPLHGNALRPT